MAISVFVPRNYTRHMHVLIIALGREKWDKEIEREKMKILRKTHKKYNHKHTSFFSGIFLLREKKNFLHKLTLKKIKTHEKWKIKKENFSWEKEIQREMFSSWWSSVWVEPRSNKNIEKIFRDDLIIESAINFPV